MTFFRGLFLITLFLFCAGFCVTSYSAAGAGEEIEEAAARFRRGLRDPSDIYLLITESEANEDARYYFADQVLQGSEDFSVDKEVFPEGIRGNRSKVLAYVLHVTGGDDSEGYFEMLEGREAGAPAYSNARKRLIAILNREAQADDDEREDNDFRLSELEVYFDWLASQDEAA